MNLVLIHYPRVFFPAFSQGRKAWLDKLQPYNDIHSKVSYWFPYNMRSKKQVQKLRNDDASLSRSE